LKFKDDFLSPHLLGLLKKKASRLRRVYFVGHVNVRNKGLEQEQGSTKCGHNQGEVMASSGRGRAKE